MHVLLPGELVDQVDALAGAMIERSRGLSVTRTDIVRMAVHRYVDEEWERWVGPSPAEIAAELRPAASKKPAKK